MIDYTALLKKLSPDRDGEPHIHLRAGTVSAVNSNGTLDVTMSGGVTVPGVPKLDHVRVSVGAVVQMISLRGSLLVLGASSQGAAPVTAFVTANPTTNSTTYTALTGGDILGVAFIAPASGAVQVTIQGWLALSSATLSRRAFMAPQIRAGSTVNSGAVVVSASDEYAAISQNSVASSFDYKYVHFTMNVTGLTPGSAYNAVAMHRIGTSGDNSAGNDRHIFVRPI